MQLQRNQRQKIQKSFLWPPFPNSLHSSWGELLFQKDLVLDKENDFLRGKQTPNWETPHCDDHFTTPLNPDSWPFFLSDLFKATEVLFSTPP